MDAAPGTYWRDAPSSGSKLKRSEKSSELLLSEEVLDDLRDDVLVEDCLIGFLELEAVLLVAQNWQVSKLLVSLVKEGRS